MRSCTDLRTRQSPSFVETDPASHRDRDRGVTPRMGHECAARDTLVRFEWPFRRPRRTRRRTDDRGRPSLDPRGRVHRARMHVGHSAPRLRCHSGCARPLVSWPSEKEVSRSPAQPAAASRPLARASTLRTARAASPRRTRRCKPLALDRCRSKRARAEAQVPLPHRICPGAGSARCWRAGAASCRHC